MKLEIKKNVSQVQESHRAIRFILARPDLLARQGSVQPSWRTENGATYGPYYSLHYRENGRQRKIYLGREGRLVRHVRQLLKKIRQPLREKRAIDRMERAIRANLRAGRAQIAAILRPHGLWLKGFEIRGWRTSSLRTYRIHPLRPLRRLPSLIPTSLPSPFEKGAGGEDNLLPSPFGRGAGGEGNLLPSPFGRGAGGEGWLHLHDAS